MQENWCVCKEMLKIYTKCTTGFKDSTNFENEFSINSALIDHKQFTGQ